MQDGHRPNLLSNADMEAAFWKVSNVGGANKFYLDDAVLRVKQTVDQNVNISLQVGSDPRSLIRSGVRLLNWPL